MSTKLWSVYYELERQQRTQHQQKMGVTLPNWLISGCGVVWASYTDFS